MRVLKVNEDNMNLIEFMNPHDHLPHLAESDIIDLK